MGGQIAGGDGFVLSRNSCLQALAYAYAHNLDPRDSIKPMLGEKSEPALPLRGKVNHALKEEAYIEVNMADKQEFKAVRVPQITGATPEQREKALAEKKSADPGNENDLFPSSIRQGPFKLFVITARDAVKDSKGKAVLEKGPDGMQYKKMRLVQGLIWLPGAESATLDEMVSWFATKRWGSTEPQYLDAAFTEMKDKALAAELIAHRGKMKAVPSGGGKKKGKTRF